MMYPLNLRVFLHDILAPGGIIMVADMEDPPAGPVMKKRGGLILGAEEPDIDPDDTENI